MGKLRAQSLNLVGAEMSVRIETDGRLTVFAGADKRPIATAAPTKPAVVLSGPAERGHRKPCDARGIRKYCGRSWLGSTRSARQVSTVTICVSSV